MINVSAKDLNSLFCRHFGNIPPQRCPTLPSDPIDANLEAFKRENCLTVDTCKHYKISHNLLQSSARVVVIPPLTAKAVMLDHVNAYVMSPLSRRFESLLSLTTRFPQLSANQISYFGVIIALVASKVVTSDSLLVRRLAVLIFLLRQFVDDLDGLVARLRLGVDTRLEVSITGTHGYVVDGVCDGIAFTCFLSALLWQSIKSNKNKYKLLSTHPSRDKLTSDSSCQSRDSSHESSTTRVLITNHVLFGFQMLLSCVLWNRYIEEFHRILEIDWTPIKVEIFKSRLQWMIMWMWRCFGNAHQLMNFLLVAVWAGRSQWYVQSVHVLGFAVLIGLAFLTEIHLNDVRIDSHVIWFQLN